MEQGWLFLPRVISDGVSMPKPWLAEGEVTLFGSNKTSAAPHQLQR
jgi:hypothetical protein